MDDELPTPTNPPPGRVARAASWGRATARDATVWAVGARESHASVDVGFRAADRDRRVAAMVLAGGIAYRVFFWAVSASFLVGGVLGLVGPDEVESTLGDERRGDWLPEAIVQVARSSDGNELWLLLVGGWLVLWSGYTCTKALVLAHAAVWHVQPPSIVRPLRSSLLFTGFALALVVTMAGVRWIRDESEAAGLVATSLVFVVPFVAWLGVSRWLPNRASGWRELVPGAAIMALGLQAMHLFTVYFLERKLLNATQLYGVVGVTTTMLFWLYLAARLVVLGATVNASLVEQRDLDRFPGGGADPSAAPGAPPTADASEPIGDTPATS